MTSNRLLVSLIFYVPIITEVSFFFFPNSKDIMVKVRSYACYNLTEVKIKSTVMVFLFTLLNGTNVRLNWNIESDLNLYWNKFKNFLSLY